MQNDDPIKGRGAQIHIANKFEQYRNVTDSDFLNHTLLEDGKLTNTKTRLIDTYPKTIVNRVDSPDVGMNYSLNPYQGCEHGCVYCYARNSHEYWGYDAGLDFESTILVKRNAPDLLEKKLQSKRWIAQPIVLSGNTDCYQPIEKDLGLTRKLLSLFLKYKHPVGIITKNALIQRDLDILSDLAKDNLIRVIISITSLSEETRRLLEPRTASVQKKLQTIEVLTAYQIPVSIMMAPIIPSLNSHEILALAKETSIRGAHSIGYTMVRLNGAIGTIFTDWLQRTMPDKKERILNQIKQCHGGQLNNSNYGQRMKGSGELADQIAQLFGVARKKYFSKNKTTQLNCELHKFHKDNQYKLF
ncbi:PA0069 family radical SAM protein [Aquimarina brevivitae]|uniref:DNA repair photolyase n=1 Tax=Aquimarina brevivitae TaxID=323412 RepID=A0A4Q7PF62_9FLAO|nr:PA0069 family radical SAM protein [Aquimarina brevivitae]RZS99091.1 DNA repair photolyase [Aquimarina brevivitae]